MLALVNICAELCLYVRCVCACGCLRMFFPPAGGANQGKGCECFGGAIERIGRVLRCVSCGFFFCVLNLHRCKTHKHAHNTCIQTLAHIIMCARLPYQYAHLLTNTHRRNYSHTRTHSFFSYLIVTHTQSNSPGVARGRRATTQKRLSSLALSHEPQHTSSRHPRSPISHATPMALPSTRRGGGG